MALAECCAGGVGAAIELAAVEPKTDLRPEFALFHEGPSRVLVSTASPEAVEKIRARTTSNARRIGVTMKERLRIDNGSVTSR